MAAVALSVGAGSQEALLVAYYLTGAGGSFEAVLGSALGVNITSVLAQGNATVAELDTAVQSSLTLGSLLGSQVG